MTEPPKTSPPLPPEDLVLPPDDAHRYSLGRRAALISVFGNIGIAGLKAVLAILTSSIAVWADALHSASDSITSVVVLVGLRVARRPADREHPFGHGRAETIATLVVAVLLASVGFDFGMESFGRILKPVAIGEHLPKFALVVVAGVILLTAVLKEWMARYAAKVGRHIENTSLQADAWHHRSDALSSILVAIALLAARWGYYGVDGFFGLVISLFIIYTAWGYLKDAASSLLGRAPRGESIRKIAEIAGAIHGVKDVHDVTVHDYGRRKAVSLHVNLHSGLSLAEAHGVASAIEAALTRQLGIAALVHAEPEGVEAPAVRLRAIRDAVQEVLTRHPAISSFHALSVAQEDHGLEVEFDVHIAPGTTIEAAHALEHGLTRLLTDRLGDLHVHVHVEPCDLGCAACPRTCGVEIPAGDAPA